MKSLNSCHGWIKKFLLTKSITLLLLQWRVTITLDDCWNSSTQLHVNNSTCLIFPSPLPLFSLLSIFFPQPHLASYGPMQLVVKFYKSVNYFRLPWWWRPGKGMWYVRRMFQTGPLLLIKLFSAAEYLTGQVGNSKILSRWS